MIPDEAIEAAVEAMIARRNLPDDCDINWDSFRSDAYAALTAAAPFLPAPEGWRPIETTGKPAPETMLLQARKPDGGEWVDIFPAQLSWLAKEGNEVRAIVADNRGEDDV